MSYVRGITVGNTLPAAGPPRLEPATRTVVPETEVVDVDITTELERIVFDEMATLALSDVRDKDDETAPFTIIDLSSIQSVQKEEPALVSHSALIEDDKDDINEDPTWANEADEDESSWLSYVVRWGSDAGESHSIERYRSHSGFDEDIKTVQERVIEEEPVTSDLEIDPNLISGEPEVEEPEPVAAQPVNHTVQLPTVTDALRVAPELISGSRSPISKIVLAASGVVIAGDAMSRLTESMRAVIPGHFERQNRKEAAAVVFGVINHEKPGRLSFSRDRRRALEAAIIEAKKNPAAFQEAVRISELVSAGRARISQADHEMVDKNVTEKTRGRRVMLCATAAACLVTMVLAAGAVDSDGHSGDTQALSAAAAVTPKLPPTTVATETVSVVETVPPTTVAPPPTPVAPTAVEAAPTPPPAPAPPKTRERRRTPTTKKETPKPVPTTRPAPPTTKAARTIFLDPGKPCPAGTRRVQAGEVPTKDDPRPRYAGGCI